MVEAVFSTAPAEITVTFQVAYYYLGYLNLVFQRKYTNFRRFVGYSNSLDLSPGQKIVF